MAKMKRTTHEKCSVPSIFLLKNSITPRTPRRTRHLHIQRERERGRRLMDHREGFARMKYTPRVTMAEMKYAWGSKKLRGREEGTKQRGRVAGGGNK